MRLQSQKPEKKVIGVWTGHWKSPACLTVETLTRYSSFAFYESCKSCSRGASSSHRNPGNNTQRARRLASHTLCSFATPLFFSSIELKEKDINVFLGQPLAWNRVKELYQILSSDDIADLVKTFTLCLKRESFASQPNGILISKILHRLSHIQTFALSGFSGSIGKLSDWAKDFRWAIQALCKSPNLTTLNLEYIHGFPIMVIAACPNLRHLRLWHTQLDVNLFVSLYIHNH